MKKRELVALLSLSSWCLVIVVWLFLGVPLVSLQFVIVVFPDHTHLLFYVEEDLNGCNNEILPSIILKVFNFQLFKALDSTCSRLHQRLQNSCKVHAITSRHDLKSIGKENQYLGPLHIIDRILESVMIFKSPVAI